MRRRSARAAFVVLGGRRISLAGVARVDSEHLPEHGYVVVEQVVGSRYVSALLDVLREHASFDLSDPATWAVERGSPPIWGREEIVEYDPPRQLTYTLLSGQPVRNYRAEVELTPVEDGTQIAWRSRFEPLIPGTGPLLRWFLSRIIGAMARRLAAHAGAGAARG